MNSTLVSKVDRLSDQTHLRSCNITERILGDEMPEDLQKLALINRIESLEGVLNLLPKPIRAAEIVITNNPHELTLRERRIYIGLDALAAEDTLEKAILVRHFFNNNPIAAEVIAEFILGVYRNVGLSPAHPWFRDVRTLTQYCRESDRLVIHNEFCAAHNELDTGLIFDGEYGPSAWSLKSLYVNVLAELFFESSLDDKNNILANLMFLTEPEDGFIETINQTASLQRAEAQIVQLLSDWLLPISVDKSSVAKVLRRRLISSADVESYVVVARSSRDNFPIGDWAKGYHSESRAMAVEFGLDTFFFPSDVGYHLNRKDTLQVLKPQHILYVSCEIPTVSQLKNVVDSGNVIFIKYCNETDVDWFELARVGIDQYLFAERKIQFIEFNIPALILAERLRGPLHNPSKMDSWQKWLIWQGIEQDESPMTQRPLAVIEGVKRFRYF